MKFNRRRSEPTPEPGWDDPLWVPQPVQRWIEPEEVAERLRRRRGRWRALRHAVVLLLVILVVGGVGVVAGGAMLGRWELPWSTTVRDEAAQPTASAAPTPPDCEPAVVVAARAEGTSVAILNATTRSGLAGDVSDELETRGFTVAEVGNYPTPVPEPAVVLFPVGAEPAALAVAVHLQGAVLRSDPAVQVVTAVLGDAWEAPANLEQAAAAAAQPQPSVVACAGGAGGVPPVQPSTPTG